MNMDVSNEELKELLNKFLKRLDNMDKDRDTMIEKLKSLSSAIKTLNLDLDEMWKALGGDVSITFDTEAETVYDDGLDEQDIKKLSGLIENNKNKFTDDEYLSLISSIVGEA
tara:strand:+ start:503 stop:838 length:336 start_codon:yes stop_codon:yes gene_type:complete